MKVSVIVPAYNAEKYIKKCLDSLIKQTLKQLEIIVIDDGSTDKTPQILKKYGNKIKVITQKNSGVATARNKGLEIATGDYIAFVDSDDWVEKDMFEKMYNKAIQENFDCVMCNFQYVDDSRIWPGVVTNNYDILTEKEKHKYLINMFPVIWNKIYKRNIIGNFRFKDGVWAEDVEYLYRILTDINNIGVVNETLYYYYQRAKSESRLFDKRIYSYIDNFNGIINYYKERNLYSKYELELEYCYVRYIYATFIKRATYFENKKDYVDALNVAISNVKEKFPNYRKNKYFYKSAKGLYLLCFNKLLAKMIYYLAKIVRRK